MPDTTTRLNASPREIEGSRSNRRLRRSGRVPAVLYGGDGEPVHFSVDARELRHALHGSGAVIELALDGETATAVVKDQQRDPIRGDALHIDFVRVRMDVAIQAPVTLELVGAESAPGVIEGGVLEQQTREVTVEALPGDIPETIQHDVSGLEPAGVLTLAEITAPSGVTFVDDPETVIAAITMPRLEVETPEDVETETAVVGEGEGEALAPEGSDAEPQPEASGAGEGEQPDTTSE
jgi:large subunit ribosomal protein L25